MHTGHALQLPDVLQHLIGQSRQQAHKTLGQSLDAPLQVIAGLDHLDDSRREWFPHYQLSLRYDLNDCVQSITLGAQANVQFEQQPISQLSRRALVQRYRERQQPLLNLGSVLVSLSEGLSFCFRRQQLTCVYWSADAASNGVQ